DVFLFEVGQIGNDLGWRHAVRDEVHDVGDRDTETADRRPTRQYIWILCEPVKRVCHAAIIPPRIMAARLASYVVIVASASGGSSPLLCSSGMVCVSFG